MNASSGGLREHLERHRSSAPPATSPTTRKLADEEEYVAYANGRLGTRPQLTVVFRKADGSSKTLSYAHFYGIEAENEAEGFVVLFSRDKVRIQGRNLDELFRFLCLHRPAEIVEAGRNQVVGLGTEAPVVERIEFVGQ